MANFFIRRPIVAIVISILTVLLGVVTIKGLSIEQYPFLAPPNIRVTATYPGASAEAVEQSVATPIEQEVNGVDRLIYMKSSNTSDGRMLLDVNFEVGTDQDIANVLTQNRVSSAQARLPQEVIQQGVTVKKQSPSILMLISLYSPNDSYDANFLVNYAGINLRDQLLRIPGIAQVDLFGGTDYGMRIWIRPDKLANLGLTPADVIAAIKEQNLQAPAGRVGGAPTPATQAFTETVSAPGRLVTPAEFENIIVRQTASGAVVRIKDVGRAELGSQDYNAFGRLNGKPAGAMAVYLLPGANQLRAAETIYETMRRAKELFPPDVDYKIVYDTTPAVEASIHEILKTFVEALILVTLVVFVFLQNFRATIIPLLTIPVSLIGTFIFFPVLGFSVNTLTMFGLVLAIGIVVDDAIVVVEAVIHHLEHGLESQGGHHQGHGRGLGPGGGDCPHPVRGVRARRPSRRTGRKHVQAVRADHRHLGAALGLQRADADPRPLRHAPQAAPPRAGPAGRLLPRLQQGLRRHHERLREHVAPARAPIVPHHRDRRPRWRSGPSCWDGRSRPGSSRTRTRGSSASTSSSRPGHRSRGRARCSGRWRTSWRRWRGSTPFRRSADTGPSPTRISPITGRSLLRLKPWDERKGEALHVKGIMAGLAGQFAAIPEAVIFPFNIPTLAGFGAASGFNFLLQDRSGSMTVQQLGEQTAKFLAAGRARPELGTVFTSFDPSYPQVRVELDREKARTLGVPVNEVFQTMSAALGGAFVNDFNRFGRLYRVYVQADAEARLKAADIGQIYVRSKTTNSMVPLSTLVTIKNVAGTELTTRFNLLRSVEIQGAPARGYTSGQALAALEQVFADDDAQGDGLRLLLAVLPGEDRPARRAHVHHGHRVRVPAAGRDVRELAAALGGAPGLAAGGPGRLLRRLADGLRQQRLRADRPGDADRPGRQERHPHRGVRQSEARGGGVARGGRPRVGPTALPAHLDDGVRLHPGRRAADARHRCRRGCPERDGHGGVLGHADRHLSGRVHHPRQFCVRRRARPAPTSGGAGRRARTRARHARRSRACTRRIALMRQTLCGLMTALALTGCTVGPDYRRPPVNIPSTYRGPTPAVTPQHRAFADLEWWKLFQDEQLQALIGTALEQNYDLRIAATRILQARAQVTIARSFQFPTADGAAAAPLDQFTGGNRPPFTGESGLALDQTFLPQAGFSVAWELDLWGRFRRATEAARAELLASDDFQAAVVSDPDQRRGPCVLRAAGTGPGTGDRSGHLTSRAEYVRLTKAREEGGVSTLMEVRQAEQLYYAAAATIADRARAHRSFRKT